MSPHPPRRHGARAALVALGVVVAVLAMHGLSLHHLEHLGQTDHASHHSAVAPAVPDSLSGVEVACSSGPCVAVLVGGLLLLALRRRASLHLPRGDDRAHSCAARVLRGTAARPPPVPRLHLVLSVQRC